MIKEGSQKFTVTTEVTARVTTEQKRLPDEDALEQIVTTMKNPEDMLIAEGYPMLDQETGTIAVFVSNATTKFLQAAGREKQRADV